jgi:hypothetical protein
MRARYIVVAALSALVTSACISGRLSVDGQGAEVHGASAAPVLNAGSQFVAFQSDASDLVPNDTNGVTDVFVRDNVYGTVERVSVDSSGGEGNAASQAPSVSEDGRIVAFESLATNLVADDTNGEKDIFVHDRQTGVTTLIGGDSHADLSATGRFVAYQDDNAFSIPFSPSLPLSYVHDRVAGTTTLVFAFSGPVPSPPVGSGLPSISDDGTRVAFETYAPAGGVSSPWAPSIWLHDASGNRSIGAGGGRPAISGEGQFVAYVFDPLGFLGSPQIEIAHLGTPFVESVSVDPSGNPGDGASFDPAITDDGRYVVFASAATTLVSDDTNSVGDIFVRDRNLAATTLVSRHESGELGNGDSVAPDVADTGNRVAFSSVATNLVTGDTNGVADVFARPLQ